MPCTPVVRGLVPTSVRLIQQAAAECSSRRLGHKTHISESVSCIQQASPSTLPVLGNDLSVHAIGLPPAITKDDRICQTQDLHLTDDTWDAELLTRPSACYIARKNQTWNLNARSSTSSMYSSPASYVLPIFNQPMSSTSHTSMISPETMATFRL